MSAFVTEYPDVVRAVVSDVGVITDITGTQVQAVRCKALWDTGAAYSVISNAFAAKLRLQEFDRGRNYTAQGSYETLGFRRLDAAGADFVHGRIKPKYDHGCVFMFRSI